MSRPGARVEDHRLLTGRGTFIDNLGRDSGSDAGLGGAGHVAFVRSSSAHARIRRVDVSAAEAAAGVLGVFTADTLGLAALAPEYVGLGVDAEMVRWPLARDRVRFVGEPIAAVVATSAAAAADAVDLVEVDDDILDPVVTVERARRDDVLLFPDAGTNLAFDLYGDSTDDLFDGCDAVVAADLVNQRVAPCPLEVRAGAARWDDDGRLTQWVATQTPHAARTQISMVLGIDEERIRVITPDVGGGFGAKIGVGVEELMLGRLAALVGRPVRFCETRTESMQAMGHGRAQQQRIEIGGSRDGRIEAYRLTIAADCGAYPRMGAILPSMTGLLAGGAYDIERVEVVGGAYVTNSCPVVAYRGAGRPEAAAAIERAVDLYAAEVGLDPVVVRRRNLVAPDRFPYDTATGATYDSGDYGAALDRLCDELGLDALRAEQAARRRTGDRWRLGVGVATYVEITAPLIDGEWANVEITPDGGAVGRVGTVSQGQGHETTYGVLLADRLGVPVERVEIRFGDTDEIRRGEGTLGSRSMQVGGPALRGAADLVIEAGRELAARLLEAAVDDIVFEAGRFQVAGTPARALGWAELAADADRDRAGGDDGDGGDGRRLNAELVFDPEGSTFPSGAHGAVVEVDTETGQVRLVRMVAVDDAGTVLDPVLAAGQIHGGLAQGAAQALMEEFVYDGAGNPVTSNLADYPFVSACELPSFEVHPIETPTPLNVLGVKGIGESGTIGAAPAIQNAVVDALADLGVRHLDMPLTPETVWSALRRSGRGDG